jgi:endo-1,3(4)-beta-glucanase
VTITLPISTFETVVKSELVTSLPIETTATITQVTVLPTTVSSNGSIVATSEAGTTVLETTGTALVETTLTASSTITGTAAITWTMETDSLTSLPTASPTCLLTLGCYGQDIFQPIALGPLPNSIGLRGGHPVPLLGITDAGGPIETNKFYQNFVLGSQTSPSFLMPYSISWASGSGNALSWGMAISHVEDSQKVFGPKNTAIPDTPASYYINPIGIQSLILSAAEFAANTKLTTSSISQFSANVHLQPASDSPSSLTLPLVQGMSFVTGQYVNLQPAIQTSVFFRSVTAAGQPKPGIFKYRVVLEDNRVWLIYARPANGLTPNFELKSSTLLRGIENWYGDIQIAKVPDQSLEALYDDACGAYPTAGHIAGFAHNTTAQYSLSWTKDGAYADNTTLLMFSLPHHRESFDPSTQKQLTNLTLATTTKGNATAVLGDFWVLEEKNLPVSLGFAPWRPNDPTSQAATSLSAATISFAQSIAAIEASQNMSSQTNLNSMYYSGKALSKFAQLIYAMHDLLNQQDLAKAALLELERCFDVFAKNQQMFPLLYDTDWKGLVSSASYVTGDPGVDFGNSYYNDHHFHYGYFLHCAAVIGYLDPTWIVANKDYVNALARDVSNPSSLDQWFPVSRSYDWFQGHSWAKGLFESGDGKDEESSSEDAMFAYGLKMWGKTIGDASMEARGNLMLSVLSRSLDNYFLMTSDNVNQPAQFIGNKVTGILFEGKADHVTYFGSDLSYVQG